MSTQATNETIIKGWIKAENITIGNEVYNFVLNEEPKYVVLGFGNTFLKVSAAYCDTKDYLQLCVDDVQFNRTDPVTRIRYYKAYVTLKRLNAELTAARTAIISEGVIGDSFEITTTFQNTGLRKATDIFFVEKIPNSFTINIDKSNCNINLDSNIIFWKGDLDISQKTDCKYSIISSESGVTKLESNISYNNGLTNKTIIFSPIAFNIKNGSLEIQKSLSTSKMEVSSIFTLNASVTNVLAEEDPEVLFKVDVPKELRILNKTYEFDKDGNIVSWSGKLSKGHKINLSLTLILTNYGNFSIPIIASYTTSGKDKIFINRVNISSIAIPLEVIYLPSSYYVNSSQNFSLYIALKGNTNKYFYKNIEASLSSDIPNFKSTYKNFEKQFGNYSILRVFNDSFTIPDLKHNTTFNITLKVNYETEFDQKMSILKNYEIFFVETYNSPEEKHFNLPLDNLKNKINDSIPLPEQSASSVNEKKRFLAKLIYVIPKSKKGILIAIISIFSLALFISLYLSKRSKRETIEEQK